MVLYLPVLLMMVSHDDVINWKHFPRFWPLVRGIHRSPVNPSHKYQWREALMFSLICARINGWVNNGEAGDLRRHRAHYDVIVNNASGLPHSCTQWGSHMYHIFSGYMPDVWINDSQGSTKDKMIHITSFILHDNFFSKYSQSALHRSPVRTTYGVSF